jgi:hypothetical protein
MLSSVASNDTSGNAEFRFYVMLSYVAPCATSVVAECHFLCYAECYIALMLLVSIPSVAFFNCYAEFCGAF